MQVRRNCDLFSWMLVRRGGIKVNATHRMSSADFLLGPYGSGLTTYASKQAVLDSKLMIAPVSSDHAVYSSAAALAQENGLGLRVFGMACCLAARTGRGAALAGDAAETQPRYSRDTAEVSSYRRGFEAVLKAAEDCDTGCDAGGECDCQKECVRRAGVASCLGALRVGFAEKGGGGDASRPFP